MAPYEDGAEVGPASSPQFLFEPRGYHCETTPVAVSSHYRCACDALPRWHLV
jgi:hypothetical protein